MTDGTPFRLVCFPPAGGSSATFRSWRLGLPDFTIDAIDLPGRNGRRAEPPAGDLVTVAGELARTVARDEPYALVGHSFGGLLAFEVGRRIAGDGLPPPAFVLVAGSRPPHHTSSRMFAPLLKMNDDDLIDALAAMGAISELLRTTPLRSLFLPALRTDLALIVSYVADPEHPPVPLNLVAWHADEDALAPTALGMEWARHTTGTFTHTPFPGGHFFLYDNLPGIDAALRALIGAAGSPDAVKRAQVTRPVSTSG